MDFKKITVSICAFFASLGLEASAMIDHQAEPQQRREVVFVSKFFFSYVSNGGNSVKNQVLSQKQKDIVLVASNTAKGDIGELKKAIIASLNNRSLTVNEIKEILVQMYAYCGFPRSLNGINAFLEIIKERKAAGIEDREGEEGKDFPDSTNRNEYGENVRANLVGANLTAPYAQFVPVIDDYLKEHLFADIFSRGVLTHQEREIATIAALASRKGVEAQRDSHIKIGLNLGLNQMQIDAILSAANVLKNPMFGLGEENTAFAKYFSGKSYLNPLTQDGVRIVNVTFEPGCRNNWHIHHGGRQILLCTDGCGYYQEWGKPAQELRAGDVVNIPPEIKHWHGAAKDSGFAHIAIEVPLNNETASTEWCEKVDDGKYGELK